jgi:hypothetical protein
VGFYFRGLSAPPDGARKKIRGRLAVAAAKLTVARFCKHAQRLGLACGARTPAAIGGTARAAPHPPANSVAPPWGAVYRYAQFPGTSRTFSKKFGW